MFILHYAGDEIKWFDKVNMNFYEGWTGQINIIPYKKLFTFIKTK